jgi:hypothetical protein
MQACIPKVETLVVVHGAEIVFQRGKVDLEFRLHDDCKTLEIYTSKELKRRSDVTKDLHSPKYRQRVKPGKKKDPEWDLDAALDAALDEVQQLENDRDNG